MRWIQRDLKLKPYSRGFHLITHEVITALPEISTLQSGILHVFIQHTSASITINENTDATVRSDFESFFTRLVPENTGDYIHNYEGLDDMPAHLKASILGFSVQIPLQHGKLKLGTWQGIYLGEHRNYASNRMLFLTLFGQ